MDSFKESGTILVDGLKLYRFQELEILKFGLDTSKLEYKLEIVSSIWTSIYVFKATIDKESFKLRLNFNSDRLSEVVLVHLFEGEHTGWESWSERQERERDKIHRSWLQAELGSMSKAYDWG